MQMNTLFIEHLDTKMFRAFDFLSITGDSRYTPYERKEAIAIYWNFNILLVRFFIDRFKLDKNSRVDISRLLEWEESERTYEHADVTVDVL